MPRPANRFAWCDLMAADLEAAAAFYGEVFGWTFEVLGEGPLRVAVAGERRVAGLLPVGEGGAPHWLCHVAVEDVGGVCRKVGFVQGEVLLPPEEAEGAAIVMDPSGALLGLMPGQVDAVDDHVGAVVWHELLAGRPDLGTKVYQSVLDWKAGSPTPTPTGACYTLKARRQPVASLRAWPVADDAPAAWVPVVRVAVRGDASAKAKELGAQSFGLIETPVGDAVILADPQGVLFGIC